MNISKWIIDNLLLILTIIIFMVVCIFICSFKTQNISEDISHWGNFGDYIGGVLNPIFAIVNIIILVYFYNYLRKREENDLFLEFRLSFYRELCQTVDIAEKSKPKNLPVSILIEKVKLHENSLFLFMEKDNFLKAIIDNTQDSLENYKDTMSSLKKEKRKNIELRQNDKQLSPSELFEHTISLLNKEITDLKFEFIKLNLHTLKEAVQALIIKPYNEDEAKKIENRYNKKVNDLRAKLNLKEK